ncbi:MAG: hypothetical protein ACPGJU_04415 [Coraliomargarita sp.]
MSKLAEELLRPKAYHAALEAGRKPNVAEMRVEWFDSANILKHRAALGSLTTLAHYLFCITVAIVCLAGNLSIWTPLWFISFLLLMAHFYHTFWYHRYCSHKAFNFSSKLFPMFMQWTNPLLIKEETYVIPHFVHHKLSDKPHDPYGPHLGPLASILAAESAHHFNPEMSDKAFKHCRMLLDHLPSKWQTKEQFIRNGSFEVPWLYPLRFVFVNLFWVSLFGLILKQPELLGAWYAATIIFIVILRDFNYRGHDEDADNSVKIDKNSLAVNQWFYGYLASEWHDNHHRFAASAKCGFRRFEFDASFSITKLLKKLGVISSYVDSSKSFEKDQQAQTEA